MIFSNHLIYNNESLLNQKRIEEICDFTLPGRADRIKRIYFQLQTTEKNKNLYSKLDKMWNRLLQRLENEIEDGKSVALLQTIYFLLGSIQKKNKTKEEIKFVENVSESSMLLFKGSLMLMKRLPSKKAQTLIKSIASLICLLSYNKDFMNSPKAFLVLKELVLWIDHDVSSSFLASVLMFVHLIEPNSKNVKV